MEHLLLPTGVELTEQEPIPCVCLDDYLGIAFLEYPSSANPSYKIPNDAVTAWFQAEPSPLGLPAFQRFLQTWLFFGLIQEVFSTSFRQDDFIRCMTDGSRSRSVLTTAKLRERADTWIDRVSADQKFDRIRAKHLRRCFQVTYFALCSTEAGFDAKLKFGIAAVAETLMQIVARVCELKKMDGIFSEEIAWNIFDDQEARRELFRRSGWCPAQAALALEHHKTCQSAHFLSHLRKKQIENGHQICKTDRCVAAQIDIKNYTPLHYQAHCTCQDIIMDQQLVLKILNEENKENIVLLDLRWDEISAEITVHPIPSEKDSFYVAISHVWADGLGNPHINALPRCQLRRIFDLLTEFENMCTSHSLQKRPYLWLDTLCCPIELEAKKLALKRMPQTYREATHVLVLEASLLETKLSIHQPVDTLARICTSAWMYRLWTLQEAFLAKKLWVQFSGDVVDVGQLAYTVASSWWPAASIDIVHQLIQKTDELQFVAGKHEAGDLFYLATALKYRDVTVEFDEPLCIATFLGLDVGLIAMKSAAERMERVWSSIDNAREIISRDMIFYVGPRLTTPGYMWAPKSLLHVKDQSPFFLSHETPRASISERGLMLSCAAFPISFVARVDGILTRSTMAALDAVDFLRDENNRWYAAFSTIEQRKHATDLGREKTSEIGLGSMYEILAPGGSDFEVLIQKPLQQDESRVACLLVKVMEVGSQNTKYVHACRQFSLQRLDLATSELLNCVFQKAEALQQAEITKEIIRTAKDGKQSPEYRASLGRFLEAVNLFVEQFIEGGHVNVPNTYLGLNEYPRKALPSLLSRFYRNRHLIMGKVFSEPQSYCVD